MVERVNGLPRLRARRLAALLLVAGMVCGAEAQRSRQPVTPPSGNAPGQSGGQSGGQPVGSAMDDPEMRQIDGPYIKRTDPKNWTMTFRVDVAAREDLLYSTDGVFPVAETWNFQSANVVFPILPPTAGFTPAADNPFSGTLTFAERLKVSNFEVLAGYPSGTRLARWDLVGVPDKTYAGGRLTLEMKISGTSYKVEFDEAAASKVPWPTTWPAYAMSAMQPEAFITHHYDGREYDMSEVRRLVQLWTKGKPQEQPPVITAKWIAGSVMEHVQVTGTGFGFSKYGRIQGINAQGAPMTALEKKGSQFDMACLLVACYREAGIPARLVVGYDVASSKEERNFLKTSRVRTEDIRAWVEFALYDEARDLLTWVPVDPVAMRKQSSRMRPFNRPWEFFGTNDELQGVVPFAFQLQPPTTVRAYGTPGFWGWFVTPQPPERAEQWLSINASSTPNTSAVPNRSNRPNRRN